MPFHFSIRDALKKSWTLYKNNFWYFAVLGLVGLILGYSPERGLALSIVIVLASIIWGYVLLSSTLAAVDGKNDLLKFRSIRQHFPSLTQLGKLLLIYVIVILIITAGTILLIIPGIYCMVRLSFASLSLVDQKGSVKGTIKHSWKLAGKDVFWTVFLMLLVVILLTILGGIAFGIGFFITYPLATLAFTYLYRALVARPPQEVIVQPVEIPAEAA